jgi:protein-arginine kinase activator protein McsA
MQDLIAQEILKILMKSGIFREEKTAIEVLESAPESWISELEESASFAAISSLQESLDVAVLKKDFETAKIIKEKIGQLSQS